MVKGVQWKSERQERHKKESGQVWLNKRKKEFTIRVLKHLNCWPEMCGISVLGDIQRSPGHGLSHFEQQIGSDGFWMSLPKYVILMILFWVQLRSLKQWDKMRKSRILSWKRFWISISFPKREKNTFIRPTGISWNTNKLYAYKSFFVL